MKLRLARKVVQQPTAWLRRPRSYARAVARVHKSWRTEDRRFRRERLARERAGEKRPECDNCDGAPDGSHTGDQWCRMRDGNEANW